MTELSGEAACLSAAALWAVAVAVFRDPIQRHGARTVNLVKCVLGLSTLAVVAVVTGQIGALADAPRRDLVLVALSGVVGLTVGDTALFAAVGRLGPYRTLLFQNLAPAFTAATAWAWLGRLPTAMHGLGSVVTLAGVVWVLTSGRGPASGRRRVSVHGRWTWAGVALAGLAAAGQGAGIVLAKAGMASLNDLSAATLRLGAGVFGLALVMARGRTLAAVVTLVRPGTGGMRVVLGTLLGTVLAFFLMMVGIARAPETVAAVLLATTPVFGLFVDSAVGRERITPKVLSGTALAVAGVVILSLAGRA